ncbi:fumarate hydratase [Myroides odoratimimus]|uniref:Fumarate hydratase class I n=3 Tax=Myroides TaxID=76831 RepID=A0AAI8G474_9FLAO|nr:MULTISPECIES: fumarate hydratase [Myroides]AJH16579.1 fumarate hydratase, class I [Myroides profundi]ALU25423.1 fumarate hydratase [Myroides odoratimimus]EHO05153.1 hydrolyase, tartrate beta subunit/fumarate domain-containing protein, Fe-S type [Myroides odoratimimus CCUG 12901]EHO05635.1 hydrolyase, tartrate beta subunit/fumarate domain-containing protein, Fe-S type [Myroides odoratimimus CIP 101113]EKB02876.1 hydrolyase, tartrate beta subunit/fumarate domain-containing protein, Fe-S type 
MDFIYQDPYPIQKDDTQYKKISSDYVKVEKLGDREILVVDPKAIEMIAETAMTDVSFMLRTSHLEKLKAILDDPEATDNDRFVAYNLLQNAKVAVEGQLPSCQDTGTAIVVAKKGENVYTGSNDAESLSKGIFETYQKKNLRYSQIVPISMFEEKNSGSNLPAQIDIYATQGAKYEFLFLAKGGGSANKTFLYQKTKSLLNDKNLTEFIKEKIMDLGTAACPPYHLALVIGGTSAEANLAAVKKASAGYYDNLPTSGNMGGQAFRDLEWEKKLQLICQESKIGAQFGGKYFTHDVRVIRLPRHAASCPVGLGVSCSADRNIKAKITAEGLFVEQLETDPGRFLPAVAPHLEEPVVIDLDKPMKEQLAELTKHPIKTRVMLNGTVIVARDIAHAKIQEMLDNGQEMPEYFKNHPVYYAGPAKTPDGMPSGSFGPTTAGRMDPYVDSFQAVGGSMIMLAKGNRSQAVTDACKKHGGFYLGSIGGPAAILAKENILSVEVVDFPELGMEAVRKIVVKDFPAFIITDDKGNDFFADL